MKQIQQMKQHFSPRCIYSAHTVNLIWTGYVPPMQLQDNNRPINWHAPIHNRFLWPKRNSTSSFPKGNRLHLVCLQYTHCFQNDEIIVNCGLQQGHI